MRILIYNWAPLKQINKGGGVSVYVRNILDSISKNSNDDVYFLSSGVFCDEKDSRVRYEEMSNDGICREFSIINSPVFSPAYLTFCRLDAFFTDNTVKEVFKNFLRDYGPFDVVHFNNIEGLSLNTFDLKKEFANTRFVFSIHNYNIFCPQVNLWRNEEKNCDEKETGENCISCMTTHVPAKKLIKKMNLTYELYKLSIYELDEEHQKIAKDIDKEFKEEEDKPLTIEEENNITSWLKEYRRLIVKKLNDNIDQFIAVSDRVKTIAIDKGIDRQKIQTLYIGTKFAKNGKYSCNSVINSNAKISLIYMGYQRCDKGFFFLVDALNKLDSSIAKYIDLTLAAKGEDYEKRTWSFDESKFNSFTFINGYNHEMLEDLLKGKNLGIVPVLWEDNLPQVAMEMVSHGVPILSSDLGGVSELCQKNDKFVFKAGNKEMLISKIEDFVNKPELLDEYYKSFIGLKTMHEHMVELYKVYSS